MEMNPYENNVGQKLTIISGTCPEDEHTALTAFQILQEDYLLKNVTLIINKDITPEIKKKPKESWPISYGNFTDGETRFDAGERSIKDFVDSKHIVFIKHFLTPLHHNHINDNLMEIRAFGSLIDRIRQRKAGKPQKITLASPYLPYVRSHSIEKYEEGGFFQANTLELVTSDWNKAGINEVIGIDPHSTKIWELLVKYDISFQHMDPFKDPSKKDWTLYGPYTEGLSKEERIKKLAKTCPFVNYFFDNHDRFKDYALVRPDKGSYNRVKDFAFSSGIGLENMIAFQKERDGEGKNRILGIEHNSIIREGDINGREFLIIDDLIASGGTAIETGRYLKERGAKKVHIWVSHNAGSNQERLETTEYIDSLVMLDSVRNKESEKFMYLPASGIMLAAAIYKSHMNLEKGSALGNF